MCLVTYRITFDIEEICNMLMSTIYMIIDYVLVQPNTLFSENKTKKKKKKTFCVVYS